MRKILGLVLSALLWVAPASAQYATTKPFGVPNTTVSITITATGTPQTALALKTGRIGCGGVNAGTHVMYIYFGLIGNALTTNSYPIQPGQTFSCATATGAVITDAVIVLGTSGDILVVTSQ